jgi:hypothetical protein
MATPIDFPSTTANLDLPLLFAGQAQKEFFLNEALSTLDALVPAAVVRSDTVPPIDAKEAQVYRVLPGATGDWTGEDDKLAMRKGAAWSFVDAARGMQIFDQQAGQRLLFDGAWQAAVEPAVPTGGDTIDTEARAAVSAIVNALRASGILPRTPAP